ncbi:class I mannose-6-phosphate isomerase [uncultured Microbacterium sp.]|uniref:class I mannose-6-phosphate isomerase n=1 Tax=uncultured Microbacterium sp. TaxID=191216 RepID=UPI0025D8108D|nr:class I mannose-6-phosphate isomerase [uncultured Microbacterium sp.]
MNPVLLPPNPVQHFYLGGDRIAALRGIVPETDRQPEEWLGSTVSRFGSEEIGLAVTDEGAFLRDLVTADRAAWVGARGGRDAADLGILVKLLDARQRLPVHVHPDRAFAGAHLDCPYGKTEAWFVLETEDDCAVHVGWNQDVDRDELDRRRDAQDSEWMLSRMNRVVVRPGMGVLVPAGTVHAIDGGIFVAEVQEPTDFSILLEWSVTTSTREESHLDLGFDAVMPAVSTAKLDAAALDALISTAGTTAPGPAFRSLMPAAADAYFRLFDAAGDTGGDAASLPAGFAVVLVREGSGALVSDAGTVEVERGQVYAVPHAFGAWRLTGAAEILVAAPGAGWPATLRGGGAR